MGLDPLHNHLKNPTEVRVDTSLYQVAWPSYETGNNDSRGQINTVDGNSRSTCSISRSEWPSNSCLHGFCSVPSPGTRILPTDDGNRVPFYHGALLNKVSYRTTSQDLANILFTDEYRFNLFSSNWVLGLIEGVMSALLHAQWFELVYLSVLERSFTSSVKDFYPSSDTQWTY